MSFCIPQDSCKSSNILFVGNGNQKFSGAEENSSTFNGGSPVTTCYEVHFHPSCHQLVLTPLSFVRLSF